MKLFLTVVLASLLMMKTAEGAVIDLGEVCFADDICPTNAACVDDAGTLKCSCMDTYTEPTSAEGTCKKIAGQTCEEDTDCADGTCGSDRKKCGKANDAECTSNTQCASGNCKLTVSGSTETEKCVDSGAAGVVASVLLMVATWMISRIL